LTGVSFIERLGRRLRRLGVPDGSGESDPTLHPGASRRGPVLLLSGFASPRRAHAELERQLRRDGFRVFSLNLSGLLGAFGLRGIDDLADQVRVRVERLYARDPELGPLTIVGHSAGGLVGAYYLKRLGGWRRSRALVTVGTPHQGTPLAYAALPLGPLAPSLWQLAPGSSFLERLRGPWPRGVRVTSIYSRHDRVTPFPSAVLDTLGHPLARNVELETAGHRELLLGSRAYGALVEELRALDASPAPGALRLVWDISRTEPPGAGPGPARAGTQERRVHAR